MRIGRKQAVRAGGTECRESWLRVLNGLPIMAVHRLADQLGEPRISESLCASAKMGGERFNERAVPLLRGADTRKLRFDTGRKIPMRTQAASIPSKGPCTSEWQKAGLDLSQRSEKWSRFNGHCAQVCSVQLRSSADGAGQNEASNSI